MSKIELSFSIPKVEIKDAISRKAFLYARSMEAAGKVNYELSSHMQPSDLEPDSSELEHAISSAVSSVRLALCEYLKGGESERESDDAVTLLFSLPGNYNRDAFSAVRSGVVDYIVMRSLYEWYRETYPDISAACDGDASSALARCVSALYKRRRPLRPCMCDQTEKR